MSCLKSEAARRERFAARFILVRGCQAWDALLSKLSYEVDDRVRLSEFCSGSDVFPNMDRVYLHLKEQTPADSTVLLLPLAEHVRLDPEGAESVRSLAQWPCGRVRRLYIPLLDAEDWFLPEMERLPRYREGLLPDVYRLIGGGDSEIIVTPFRSRMVEGSVIEGIRDYLAMWEQGSVRKAWLVTSMARWLEKRSVRSGCAVRIYPSSFDYVRENLNWAEVEQEWGSSDQWEWLAANMKESEGLDEVARRLLNVAGYDAEQILTLWKGLSQQQKWLAWLWTKARSKPGSYLHHVISQSRRLDEFARDAVMGVFEVSRSLGVSSERKVLLERLGITHLPPEFWQRFKSSADPVDRVAVLTDITEAEREQLVLTVGELLESHDREVWWDFLALAFPNLASYLQPVVTGDEFADAYFAAHNRCRLRDERDQELASLIDRWASQELLWSYPSRSSLLAQERSKGARVIWVDAMGAEWTGLLTHLLSKNNGEVEYEVRIARANLPTITQSNKEWEPDDEIVRGLDDIAHHYAYSFPTSFVKAIEVVKDVARKAAELLATHPVVVITSDHGLSRFAATSQDRVTPPEGASVEPRGRYVSLHEGAAEFHTYPGCVMEERAIYLLTHSRFKGANHCPGEVHSGATPEECLTPLIVARAAAAESLPHLELATATVRLNTRGEGLLTIRSDRQMHSLELRLVGSTIPGSSTMGMTWSFQLKGLQAGKYAGKMFSGTRFVGEIAFEAVRGVLKDDLGLGDEDWR